MSNINGFGFATVMKLAVDDQLDVFVKQLFSESVDLSQILPDDIQLKEKYLKRFNQCLLSFFHSVVFKGKKIDNL